MTKSVVLILVVAGVASCGKSIHVPGTPGYNIPPSNSISDALGETTRALNDRDSAAFWSSLTWEDRDNLGPTYAYRYAKTLWDSSKGSHLDVTLLSSRQFVTHVHHPRDSALFANALIDMRVTGARNAHYDSLMAVLRVDNGKWVLGTYSLYDSTKPFYNRSALVE